MGYNWKKRHNHSSNTFQLPLFRRCIAGLSETTHGKVMDEYLKGTTQESKSLLKSRARHEKFYNGSSLVSVLEVLKRLMNITDDDDFESFSHKLAGKHPVTNTAVEEVNSKATNSPRDYEESMIPDDLISSLLLRRMFSPALSCFDYDSDGWRYWREILLSSWFTGTRLLKKSYRRWTWV